MCGVADNVCRQFSRHEGKGAYGKRRWRVLHKTLLVAPFAP